MENSQRFMSSFVRIEMFLKDALSNPNVGFIQMVHMAAKSNPVIRRYQSELNEYGQLRNAIVHNRAGNDEAIAEPHLEVVEIMERIVRELEEPKRIKDIFKFDTIYTVNPDDELSQVLKQQNERNYSVVPVYDGTRYVGLVHTRLYQRFLEAKHDTSIDLRTLRVKDILAYYEADDRVVFLDVRATLDTVLETYSNLNVQGRAMIAIILTEHGYVNEKPKGLLTIRDMPRIIRELE